MLNPIVVKVGKVLLNVGAIALPAVVDYVTKKELKATIAKEAQEAVAEALKSK